MTVGRTLPNNLEAEEYLLSCVMIDADEILPRCHEANIRVDTFYDPKHGIVFGAALKLDAEGKPVSSSTIAQELRDSKQLDVVGGYAFIAQVSGLIPTTVQASYFMEKVAEQATLRELIRLSTAAVEDCHNYTGDLPQLLEDFEAKFAAVRHRIGYTGTLKTLADFELPPENGLDELLGSNRYIGRGDSCLIVSSSGMGKSSLAIIWAAHIALGRPFLGVETKRPSKSLFIQAEDSDGDMGELWFSIRYVMKLTDAEMAIVRANVIIVRDKINRGPAFIASMRAIIRRVKPDFVWLNPLHAYAGCDIANAEQIGAFLREGLNKANRDDRYAYMIVHHTPKPLTGKGVADKKWHEFMYDAAGSAELVNWARAVITLKPTETEGDFNLVLAKRGKRAGVVQEVEGEASTFLQPTTRIPIRQSSTQLKIEGRKRPFHLLNWEARVVSVDEAAGKKEKPGSPTKFEPAYNDAEIVTGFPKSTADPEPFKSIARLIAQTCGMSERTLNRRKQKLRDDGLIQINDEMLYRRTAKGDELANAFLKNRQ